MTGFREIVRWELRTALGRVSTWVYVAIAFLLGSVPMLAIGGAWDFGGGLGRSVANSPYALASLIAVGALLLTSVTAAIAGNALYRDYDVGIEQLLYATPIRRNEFLGGRFASVIVVNLVILSAVGLGAALAAASPFVKDERIIAFDVVAYLSAYLTWVIPNLVLTAAIFFALVSLTRQMMPVYAGGVVLLIAYLIGGEFLGDIDRKRLGALLDPVGLRALEVTTRYWSVAEKNELYVPVEGVLLWNRLLWLGIAFAIFGLAYRRFRFSYDVGDRQLVGPAASDDARLPAEAFLARVLPAELPRVERRSDLAARWTQFVSVFARSFWRIVRNRYFVVIVGAGLLFLGVTARQAGRLFGTPTWPVTYHMHEILIGTIGAFILIVIAVYAGELVWAERDVRSHQIVDATPVPTWVLFLGKLAALCAMIALLLAVMMIAGVIAQAVKGYYQFEIPLYLQALYGIFFPDMVLLAALAMALHVLVNHKYLGHLVVILVLVGMGILPLLGLERGLYIYSYDPGPIYSDMNRWGPFLAPFVWWKAYWLLFCVLLVIATNQLWVRGGETHPQWRLRLARARFRGRAPIASAVVGAAFIGIGAFLYYNTDVLNINRTSKASRRLMAEREKRYKKFERVPQPRVVAVSARVDLHPRAQDLNVAGQFVLLNKTSVPIDSVHLSLGETIAIRSLDFDGGARRVVADSARSYHIYHLTRRLLPGDSTIMRFQLAIDTRGMPQSIENLNIVENGTFIWGGVFLPTIGYAAQLELGDDDARRKEGLPPKERMRRPTDSTTWANNYISSDADWIRFDVTVSTDPDQVALAPGYLQREWVEGGRRIFHYAMDAPILNFWAVLSGRYAVRRDRWVGRDSSINILVYHHPEHTYNVDRMVTSVKKSLDYFTREFGPYQHRQVRIVEFPRYASFAQSLPNIIPYSEAIGFIARIEKPDDIDYPFYVTSHEVAHAWWAHQVVGADAQGATMLSETLAEYSALMVMEKEFGPRNMRRFLAYGLEGYLVGRGGESKREMPLVFVENQPYVHYNKGALTMYALRDYIGEERVNRALRRFLDEKKFKGPPYPISLQLVSALRAETPDSLRYLIEDLFEKITLFEFRTDSAVMTDAPGQPGKFKVDIWGNARKLRADTLGRETPIAMRDWIDIGVYARPPRGTPGTDKNGIPLHFEKRLMDSGPQHFSVIVDQRPYRAGIDPLHKLIDRFAQDNTIGVGDRTTRPTAPPRTPAGPGTSR